MEKTIHIIEDDTFLRSLMATKLQKENFNVTVASNAEEAFKGMEEKNPNLIILDIILPNQSGFEILRKMKEDDKYKDIPVIIFSNMGDEADIKKGKDLGADEFMVKANFTLDELVSKIKEKIS